MASVGLGGQRVGAGVRRGLGAVVGAGGRTAGGLARDLVVGVPRLGVGCAGIQRGREAMQLFSL